MLPSIAAAAFVALPPPCSLAISFSLSQCVCFCMVLINIAPFLPSFLLRTPLELLGQLPKQPLAVHIFKFLYQIQAARARWPTF